MLSMSLGKELCLLQILNKLSLKHLIKLILYENDAKLLKFKKRLVIFVLGNYYDLYKYH